MSEDRETKATQPIDARPQDLEEDREEGEATENEVDELLRPAEEATRTRAVDLDDIDLNSL